MRAGEMRVNGMVFRPIYGPSVDPQRKGQTVWVKSDLLRVEWWTPAWWRFMGKTLWRVLDLPTWKKLIAVPYGIVSIGLRTDWR